MQSAGFEISPNVINLNLTVNIIINIAPIKKVGTPTNKYNEFLTSKEIIDRYWDQNISMCKFEHYPFEKPLHNIYKKELCISPIPSLAIHFTNINSIYGLSPNVDWKRLWDENSS